MTRRARGKRMTLSEHLAQRAQAAEEAAAREEARQHTLRAFKELDAMPLCTCPACVRLRQMRAGSAGQAPEAS